MIRELTEQEVHFDVECLEESMHPRDCMESGDAEMDKADAAEILRRLETNPWAWCTVKVTASWGGYRASDYLGGCSYDSERDFTSGDSDYFADMKASALAGLNAKLRVEAVKLEALRVNP
jgi:hypothetical protein